MLPVEFDKRRQAAETDGEDDVQDGSHDRHRVEHEQRSCYTCHRGHTEPERMPAEMRAKADEENKKADEDKRPVEEAFKNIQSLKGMTAGRLMATMNSFTRSLGVDCAFCHVAGCVRERRQTQQGDGAEDAGYDGSGCQEVLQRQRPNKLLYLSSRPERACIDAGSPIGNAKCEIRNAKFLWLGSSISHFRISHFFPSSMWKDYQASHRILTLAL